MELEDVRYDIKREILNIRFSTSKGIIETIGISREFAKDKGIFDFEKFENLWTR